MIVTIYLAIFLLSLVVLHVAIRSGKTARMIDKIPGPTPHPIIGNLLMFNVPIAKLWDVGIKLLDDYYPIVRIWTVNLDIVAIRSAEDIKTILSCKKNLDKCKKVVYNGFKLDGIDLDGVLLSNGEKWRQRRKLVLPSFNPHLMKVYVEIMNEHTDRMVNDMKNRDTESIMMDAVPVFRKLGLGIICEAAMGVDPSQYGVEEGEKFQASFDAISDLIFFRASRPYITDWMYWLMELLIIGRKQKRIVGYFRKFVSKIVQTRREYHEKIGYRKLSNFVDNVEDGNTKNGGTKRLALLDLLLTAKNEGLIDEKGVEEEVGVFISAGYETSGVAVALLSMLLADNKEMQDLAREEVTQLLDRTGGVLEIADLNKLDYLDRCVKESLRLFPSAPIIGRHITENIQLQNYEIPRGTEVGIHLYHLHRDPKYWPDPEKFDPDRFLPENTKKRHPFAYQPFSAGPRACIGSKFATLELKIIMARLLYNFYIEPVDVLANLKLRMHVTLKPETSCRVRLIRIKRECLTES